MRIDLIQPDSGSVTGGTSVGFIGEGFKAAEAVFFGDNFASMFTIYSDEDLVAITPFHFSRYPHPLQKAAILADGGPDPDKVVVRIVGSDGSECSHDGFTYVPLEAKV